MSRSQAPKAANVGSKANLSWKDRLHPEDYEELRNTFQVFDEDNSGTIDPA
jgi:Ca2+-binding EF-hand superfamily protein